MAKIFSDQGNPEKAADVCRYLLESNPDRKYISGKLFLINEQIAKKILKSHTIALFRERINLGLQYRNLKKLNRLSKSL
jgi:hypothetical protein